VAAADVSLVVVAFHRPEALRALLRDVHGAEVVVVNVEGDAEVAAVASAAGAMQVATAGNVGFGAAVNVGAAEAGGEVIVFCNDDLRFDADALARLVAPIRSGDADVSVPAVLDGDGQAERTIAPLPTVGALLREWFLLPDVPRAGFERWTRVQKWRLPTAPERVDAATAATVAVRADLLRLRPLPEAYFLYWEESEWFWWLRRDGVRVIYVPAAKVRHDGGRDDVRPEKSRLLARNAVRCVRRTQGPWHAALALPVVIAWNARLLIVALLRRRYVAARWAGFVAAVSSAPEVWR
jgi:GT2 family glycosyltransferase